MKASLLILAVVLVAGSGLAIMNNACKSGHDSAWCAPSPAFATKLRRSTSSCSGRALTVPERRFPPPWSVEETDACFNRQRTTS
jgi:hypothetical protein